MAALPSPLILNIVGVERIRRYILWHCKIKYILVQKDGNQNINLLRSACDYGHLITPSRGCKAAYCCEVHEAEISH